MNLSELRKIMVMIMDDYGVFVQVSPEQYSRMLHYNSLKHFKKKLGLPEEYTPGMPVPKEAYEITQKITEDLRPFKMEVGWDLTSPILVDDKTGNADYPEDYYYPGGATYFYIDDKTDQVYEREIDILSDLEFQKRLTSVNDKPTKFDPICNMRKDVINFRPYDLIHVNMSYLRLPVEPRYSVLPSSTYQQYDPETSIQLEWDEMNQLDIMIGVMADMGVKLGDQDIYQYAEKVKNTGK